MTFRPVSLLIAVLAFCIRRCRPNCFRWKVDRRGQKTSSESQSEPDNYAED